jgi:ParB/RepB/Spo0J family partition protein
MKIEVIGIEKLRDHPANANGMDEATLAKLAGHIAVTGLYEPLVVRRHPREAGCYEVLNGHHRREALRRLGRTEASCVVWEVSDAQALMLLATLNRLTGRDDLLRRARLLEQLHRRGDPESLAARLPEGRKKLEKLLTLNRPPEMAAPAATADLPRPMCFFVSDSQRAMIDRALRQTRKHIGGEDPQGKLSRGDILACMANATNETVDKRGWEKAWTRILVHATQRKPKQ